MSAALAVLGFGAAGFYLPRPANQRSAADMASPALPEIALSAHDIDRVTKIELTRPNDDDPSQLGTIALEKRGGVWALGSPAKGRASRPKVEELLRNLQEVTVAERVASSARAYDTYDLGDAKALHVVVWAGTERLRDIFFGKSLERGQMARIAGTDGVFAVPNAGSPRYSGFLYTRSLRGWRDPTVFQFQEGDAVQIEITNPSGFFSLAKAAGRWTGAYSKRGKDGVLRAPEEWRSFDPSRVQDLLAAYASLSADDFGEESDRARSGVDDAETTGGVIRIGFAAAGVEKVLRVGRLTESTTRWAIKDSRWAVQGGPGGDDGPLYALAPWTANWATANASQFETGAPRPAR